MEVYGIRVQNVSAANTIPCIFMKLGVVCGKPYLEFWVVMRHQCVHKFAQIDIFSFPPTPTIFIEGALCCIMGKQFHFGEAGLGLGSLKSKLKFIIGSVEP